MSKPSADLKERAMQPPSPPTAVPVATASASTRWYKKEYHVAKVIKPEEVMNFSRQAASFLRAGIPILEALEVIGQDNANKHMTAMLGEMQADLRGGLSLGSAMAKHSRVFPDYFVAMVRSAELTGRLDDVLDQLAGYIDREVEGRRRIKSALTYPVVIAVMAVVSVLVLSMFVLPKFKDLFASLDAKLPLATRILLAVTGFMGDYWWAVTLGIFAAIGLAFAAIGGSRGKSRRDRLLVAAPAVGPLLNFILVERFCRVLGALVRAGVPLPNALSVAAASTNNRVYQAGLERARESMMRGEGLAGPLASTKLFPLAAQQMVRVGESTGTLDKQLETAADFYERELEYKLKRFTDLFEPVVIIGVGLVVGFIAVALVSAMYGVFDQVKV